MKRYELFSKRQKRLRGEVPDVYQYEYIPQELRVQVVHIWQDVFGEIERGSFGNFCGAAYEAYQGIHDALCREYGVFALGEEENFFERVGNFLLKEKDIEKTDILITDDLSC